MLRARNLHLHVPGRSLVEDLDLQLNPGTCCALLGRNGSGKTSLLLSLAGLRRPDAGEVLWHDTALERRSAGAGRVAVLLQEEEESFWGSVTEYVALGRLAHADALRGIDDKARGLALDALRAMDLHTRARQAYRSLSAGERQRARIAQTLVQEAPILLLDEPLTHLDLGHQLLVMDKLTALAHAGSSVMLSLHEPAWAASRCAEALLLYDSGRFRHGSTREVLTADNLEALYGCRLESVGDRAFFVPSPA